MRIYIAAVFCLSISPFVQSEEPKFARTCVKATQTENGKMAEVSIAESSGYKDVDAFAKNIVKVFSVQLEKGQKIPRQTGFVLVDYFEDGSFASTIFKERGRLIKGCTDLQTLDHGLSIGP
jgi:hypothetical protein